MKKRLIYSNLGSLLFLLCFISCDKDLKLDESKNTHIIPEYARNFEIIREKNKTIVQIKSEKNVSKIELIKKPEKISVWSTTFIPYLDALGEINRIYSIKGIKWVSNEKVLESYLEGKIKNIPEEKEINMEEILMDRPDLVLTYQFSEQDSTNYNLLKGNGINVYSINPFEERHPLGRVEWIKVIGEIFNKQEQADSIFNFIKLNYNRQIKPRRKNNKVMMGAAYKGTWWSPGGQSSIVQIIKDAGGDYLWDTNQSVLGVALDLETVLKQGNKADYWINPLPFITKNEILNNEPRLGELPVVQSNSIYSPILLKKLNGANDYYETGVFRPDLILRDLNKIFEKDTQGLHWFKRIE